MTALILRALFGGLLIAAIAGPLGCFLVWRRMAFYGAAIAHASIFGLAIALALGLPSIIGLMAGAVGFALMISWLKDRSELPVDSLLGILSHVMLAAGISIFLMSSVANIDLMAFLFGDILSLRTIDLLLILATCTVLGLLLTRHWNAFLIASIHPDLAHTEGVNLKHTERLFLMMLALFVAVAVPIIGLLLVVSILIIPPAAARFIAGTPYSMALIAAGLGCLSVVLGLAGAWFIDIPAGPAIVIGSFLLFILAGLANALQSRP